MEKDKLKFLMKNLTNLPNISSLKVSDEKLCEIFEEIFLDFHHSGKKLLAIDLLIGNTSKGEFKNKTYLNYKYENAPLQTVMEMDFDTYQRFAQIVKSYGVFTNLSKIWQRGLISAEKVRTIIVYDFVVNVIEGNFGTSFSIWAVGTSQIKQQGTVN